jgi:hypothetical protein
MNKNSFLRWIEYTKMEIGCQGIKAPKYGGFMGGGELEGGSRRRKVWPLRGKLDQRILSDFGLPLADVARQLGVSASAISKLFTGAPRDHST